MPCEVTTTSSFILHTGESDQDIHLSTVRDLVSEKVCPHFMTQSLGSSPLSSILPQNQNYSICSSNQWFQKGAWVDYKDRLYTHSLSSIPSLLDCSRRESCQKHTHTTLLFVSKSRPPENLAKGKRKTIRLSPLDCEWWVSQQRERTVLGKWCL